MRLADCWRDGALAPTRVLTFIPFVTGSEPPRPPMLSPPAKDAKCTPGASAGPPGTASSDARAKEEACSQTQRGPRHQAASPRTRRGPPPAREVTAVGRPICCSPTRPVGRAGAKCAESGCKCSSAPPGWGALRARPPKGPPVARTGVPDRSSRLTAYPRCSRGPRHLFSFQKKRRTFHEDRCSQKHPPGLAREEKRRRFSRPSNPARSKARGGAPPAGRRDTVTWRRCGTS